MSGGWRNRFVQVALLGVIALGAAVSCSALEVEVPAGASDAPSPPGVPDTAQNNVSDYPVLQRLGRWNGSEFVSVGAGTIRTGTVIAMSHGWSPGFADTYQQLQAASPQLVTFWNPGFVEPDSNETLGARFENLAGALQAAAPDATIVMFSWVDQSATGPDPIDAAVGERATEVNGHRMATALDEALAAGFSDAGGEVHLIGHSFGANVATTAALALSSQPRQLTLFDSPEGDGPLFGGAANNLQYKLTRLPIGRGEGQVFVDNYISLVGQPYGGLPGLGGVVDVRLDPPDGSTSAERHEFPIGWYAQSASTSGSTVGYRWSPLAGGVVSEVGATYQQAAIDTPLTLNETAGPPPAGVNGLVAYTTESVLLPGGDARQQPGGEIELSGNGVTTSNVTFTTDEDSLWLTFDAVLTGSGGDTLSLFIDGRQRWVDAAPDAGVRRGGTFVVLYDLDPGTHTLSAVLGGPQPSVPPGASSFVQVSGLEMVSAADIVRNADPDESRDVVIWVLVVALVVIVAVALAVVWVLVALVRRIRRRRVTPAA